MVIYLFILKLSKQHIHLLWLIWTAQWCKVFILFAVASFGCPEEVTFTIRWFLKHYPCHNEYNNIEVSGTCKSVQQLCVMFFLCWSYICLLDQEMYEKTPLSRGKSMDPNPLGPGEYIQHRYRELSCRSDMHIFPMFNVRLQHLISFSFSDFVTCFCHLLF